MGEKSKAQYSNLKVLRVGSELFACHWNCFWPAAKSRLLVTSEHYAPQ